MSAAAGVGDAFASTASAGPLLLAVPVALIAGAVSFFSPCVLPLVPGYLSYVTGMTGQQLREQRSGPPRAVAGALLFVAGFGVWFVLLGVVFGGVGALVARYQRIVDVVLGVVVIVLGLAFLGVVRPLQRDVRVHRVPAVGLGAAPLLGLLFAVGWTPCVGPTLGAVLSLGLQDGSAWRAGLLAAGYTLGLGVPFVVVAALVGRATRALAWFRRHGSAVSRVGGVLLVVVGVLLVSGLWTAAVAELQGWIGAVRTPV